MMKVLLINTDAQVFKTVMRAVDAVHGSSPEFGLGVHEEVHLELVPMTDQEQAVEFISYEMPALILLNFSDAKLDAFEVMRHITADPWLNHGGIVALAQDHGTFERIDTLKGSNIIIQLAHHDLERHLGTILGIVRSNPQIIFQRAVQTDLLGAMSGGFELFQDVMLVPAYANLVANYLFNAGLVDGDAKANVSLVLTEMLMNAIEHGNCGISYDEKRAHLEGGGTIQALIAERCGDPAVRERRVHYTFEIDRTHSVHVIRDEGAGFDWHAHMTADPEEAVLAEHGRGILLARQVVDRLSYNEAGNEVTLEFRHDSRGANIPGAFRNAEVVECEAGEVIFNQGEPSDFLYYVADGLYRVIVDGRHVANLSPADVLMGEMSLLLEERRSATVIAVTRGRLIKVSKERFIRIVKNQPYYGMLLARLMAQRLHRLGRGVLS